VQVALQHESANYRHATSGSKACLEKKGKFISLIFPQLSSVIIAYTKISHQEQMQNTTQQAKQTASIRHRFIGKAIHFFNE
jgi:hypothetical protein